MPCSGVKRPVQDKSPPCELSALSVSPLGFMFDRSPVVHIDNPSAGNKEIEIPIQDQLKEVSSLNHPSQSLFIQQVSYNASGGNHNGSSVIMFDKEQQSSPFTALNEQTNLSPPLPNGTNAWGRNTADSVDDDTVSQSASEEEEDDDEGEGESISTELTDDVSSDSITTNFTVPLGGGCIDVYADLQSSEDENNCNVYPVTENGQYQKSLSELAGLHTLPQVILLDGLSQHGSCGSCVCAKYSDVASPSSSGATPQSDTVKENGHHPSPLGTCTIVDGSTCRRRRPAIVKHSEKGSSSGSGTASGCGTGTVHSACQSDGREHQPVNPQVDVVNGRVKGASLTDCWAVCAAGSSVSDDTTVRRDKVDSRSSNSISDSHGCQSSQFFTCHPTLAFGGTLPNRHVHAPPASVVGMQSVSGANTSDCNVPIGDDRSASKSY